MDTAKSMTIRLPLEIAEMLRDLSYMENMPKNKIIVDILKKQLPKRMEKASRKPLII